MITDVEEDNDTKDDDESPSLLDEEIVPAPAIEYVDDTPDEDSSPVPEYVEPSLPALSGSDLIKEDRELVLPVISHSSTPAVEDSKPRLETHQEEIIEASSLPVDQIMMIQEYVEPSLPQGFLQQADPPQTETPRQEDLTAKPYKVIYSTKTRRGGNTDEIKSKSPELEETDDDIRKAIEAMAEDLNEPKESEKPMTDRSSSLFTKQLKAKEDNASSTISPQPKPQVSDAIKKITPASKKITQSIPSTCKDLFKPDLVTKQTCASHAKPPSPVNVDLETQEKTSSKLVSDKSNEKIKSGDHALVDNKVDFDSVDDKSVDDQVADDVVIAEAQPPTEFDIKEPAKKPGSLLNRIIATIQKRLSITDEAIAVGNISTRSIKYDKHGERRTRRDLPIKYVEQELCREFDNLEVDRQIYVKETKRGKTKTIAKEIQSHKVQSFNSINTLTKIKRLSMATSTTSQPNSYLLHKFHHDLLLHGGDVSVRNEAFRYLDKIIFLHLNQPTREKWLQLVLGSLRDCPDEKSFGEFNMDNNHDLQAVWKFFNKFIDKFVSDDEDEGCLMFLHFMVKIIGCDLSSWWKHCRKKEGQSSHSLLFYLFGGSNNLVRYNMTRTVTSLLKVDVKKPGRASVSIRKMIAACALMVSYLDGQHSNSSIGSGLKQELSQVVARTLLESNLDERGLFYHLNMIQPSWLSSQVSQTILATTNNNVSLDIKDVLATASSSSLVSRVSGEMFVYKLLASHQVHTIFRSNWFYYRKGPDSKDFVVFKLMNKLDAGGGQTTKYVKFEEVSLKQKTITEAVNIISESANNQRQSEDRDSCLRALFFSMDNYDRF